MSKEIENLVDQSVNWFGSIAWTSDEVQSAMAVAAVALVGLAWLLIVMRKDHSKKVAGAPRKMSRRERNEYLKRVYADGLTTMVEDLIHQEVITRDEAQEFYRRAARQMGLFELMNKRILLYPNQQELKEAIRLRLGKTAEEEEKAKVEAKAEAQPEPKPISKASLLLSKLRPQTA